MKRVGGTPQAFYIERNLSRRGLTKIDPLHRPWTPSRVDRWRGPSVVGVERLRTRTVTATLDPKTVKRTKEIRQGHSEREPSLENTQQTRTGGENGVTSLVTVLDSCEAVACSVLRTCENAIVSRDLKILAETGRYKGRYGFST